MQQTRAAKRGIELPFTTVEKGLEFGHLKVAEHIQQQQKEYQKQLEEQKANQLSGQPNSVSFFPGSPLDLTDMEPLNFNLFLEEYENELERNLELSDQSNLLDLTRMEGEEKDRSKEDDFDLDDVDDLEPNEATLSEPSDKKKSNSISRQRSNRSNKKVVVKTKKKGSQGKLDSLKRTKAISSQNKADLIQDQQKKNSERTKKVVVSRSTEVIAKDSHTGQNHTRQTEVIKDQVVGKGSVAKLPNSKRKSLAGKLAEAKLAVQVEAMVHSAALTTHKTGRATEFQVGKDSLKFERQGEDTFAFKNGKKIPLEEAQDTLKQFGRQIGPDKMEKLSQIVKVAEQNPAIRTLAQSSRDKNEVPKEHIQEQKQVKVIKVHSR